jgi:hypothetical protein
MHTRTKNLLGKGNGRAAHGIATSIRKGRAREQTLSSQAWQKDNRHFGADYRP